MAKCKDSLEDNAKMIFHKDSSNTTSAFFFHEVIKVNAYGASDGGALVTTAKSSAQNHFEHKKQGKDNQNDQERETDQDNLQTKQNKNMEEQTFHLPPCARELCILKLVQVVRQTAGF